MKRFTLTIVSRGSSRRGAAASCPRSSRRGGVVHHRRHERLRDAVGDHDGRAVAHPRHERVRRPQIDADRGEGLLWGRRSRGGSWWPSRARQGADEGSSALRTRATSSEEAPRAPTSQLAEEALGERSSPSEARARASSRPRGHRAPARARRAGPLRSHGVRREPDGRHVLRLARLGQRLSRLHHLHQQAGEGLGAPSPASSTGTPSRASSASPRVMGIRAPKRLVHLDRAREREPSLGGRARRRSDRGAAPSTARGAGARAGEVEREPGLDRARRRDRWGTGFDCFLSARERDRVARLAVRRACARALRRP
jgi:hypothetical protein